MKKIIFLTYCFFSLVSCHYLDIDMENTKSVEGDIDYTQTDDMYQAVMGAYAILRNDGKGKVEAMHWGNCMLWTGRDDDMTSGRSDDQQDALSFGYRGGYNVPNSFWMLSNAFVTSYDVIRVCNGAIQALDKYAEHIDKDKDATTYNKYLSYVGEVKTIRAWMYYMLVTTFGPSVILRDNFQTNFIRSTVEHVYQYVIADLEASVPYMQRLRPNQMEYKGAVTAFTAEALIARFALLLGDYEKVEKVTDDIIQNGGFSLYSDYYNLFKPKGNLCDESLMEVQVYDDGVSSTSYGIDQWYNFMGAPLQYVRHPGDTVKMGGWTFMRYNPDFYAWAKERGESVRLGTSFLRGGEKTKEGWTVMSGSDTYFNGKAYIPNNQMPDTNAGDWSRHNNNVRLIRYAEVLLMNAEAKVRLGKSGDAPLNEIRSRAGLSPLPATIDNILDERRMELCAEWGLRYTDLVRTGLAATVLNDAKLVRDYKAGEWTPEKAYWPLPISELSKISDLELNPQ